jgi:hypothetical protein
MNQLPLTYKFGLLQHLPAQSCGMKFLFCSVSCIHYIESTEMLYSDYESFVNDEIGSNCGVF